MINKTPNEIYENRLTPPKAFFEWCYSQMPTYVWKNKQQTIIGSDRKHSFVTEKRLTVKSRLTFFDKKTTFEIILCTKKRIERQFYTVCSRFVDGKQEFDVTLLNLHLFTDNQYIKIHMERENDYRFGLTPVVGMFNHYFAQPEIYPNNWDKRIETISELKYVNLNDCYLDILPRYYRYRDRIEFIQKMGAKGIEKEFNNGSLDFRVVTMNWLKKWKVFLRNSDRTFKDVKLKQKIESMGEKMVGGIERYVEEYQLNDFPKQMSFVRFQNYLVKQKQTFDYYKDYLRLLEELELEITNKRRFPKDLKKAHDDAVDLINALERKVFLKGFQTRAKELSAMEMEISDFTFILPKSADDLMEEGKALQHCVSGKSYMEAHAEGHTTIVFVRYKEKMNESFFTIEYKNKCVKQLHSTKNSVPVPDELKNAVDEWVKRVNKLKKQERKQVA